MPKVQHSPRSHAYASRDDWMPDGNCWKSDHHLFFPVESIIPEKAAVACNGGEVEVEGVTVTYEECPVKDRCLHFALSTAQPNGIWGGKRIERGRIARNRRKKNG